MTIDPGRLLRLQFLVRVVRRECAHLATTDHRLFDQPFTPDRARQLATDPDLAERVDAFVGRFARLQDTLGDKLLPQILVALDEKPGAAIDNLDRAERLGFIESTDEWITIRKLRNQMVHEYVEDMLVLSDALQAGHRFVPVLIGAADAMEAEAQRRGWV
ncbi:hypothetical protein [Aromatoleum bremense]|uniref:DUF86 domain-containing protein n=1 Tax=Aromatoleum bremense TaxID=76115 RepID=A0ABX1NSF0_9RHOO|nr:hypothetical protein [Aromatoleum bremense]NMG14904.1 hypothetical protein [Aromatoleum bremense]QTQ32392.1 Uncharacterized protein pbN1_24020 [Aromatoleum bremense]